MLLLRYSVYDLCNGSTFYNKLFSFLQATTLRPFLN